MEESLKHPANSSLTLNRAEPYSLYHKNRTETPVLYEGDGYWVVTRYADVAAALRDPRLSSARFDTNYPSEVEGKEFTSLLSLLDKQLIFSDHPVHTRLKGVISKVLTARLDETMRSKIASITNNLLDKAQNEDEREMDLIKEFALPLPVLIITEMLGITGANIKQLDIWADNILNFLGTSGNVPMLASRALKSINEMKSYLESIIEQTRQTPRTDDLISALIAVHETESGLLSREELIANCILLLFTGHETITHSIGNGVLSLLQTPDQLAKLKAEPALIRVAVEELLRYDTPVQGVSRIATRDLEISGHTINKGQRVLLMLGAANRDPEQFKEPDRLDITRQENRHLTFGYGGHFCLGAALARLEIQVAIENLLLRFPNIGLANINTANELKWRTSGFRGLKELVIRF